MPLIDLQATLYAPNYAVYGDQSAILQIDGIQYPIVAIDKTSGVDVGDDVQGQTILPVAAIQAQAYLALGFQFSALSDRTAYVQLNGIWWRVDSYRLKPSPRGEKFGEIYLILSQTPVLPLSTAIIPPPFFADQDGLDAIIDVFWDFALGIDPFWTDDAGLEAQLLVTTILSANFTDDAGFMPTIVFVPPVKLLAHFVDDFGLAVAPPTLIDPVVLSANFADDFGLTVTPPEITNISVILSANFADDAGFTPTMILNFPPGHVTAIGSVGGPDNGGGVSFTVPVDIPAGSNILIAATAFNNGGILPTISDNVGNVYSRDVSRNNSSMDVGLYRCFSCIALPAGKIITVAKNSGTNAPGLAMAVWTVKGIKAPLEASNSNISNPFGTNPSVTATATHGDDVWFGALAINGIDPPGPNGGWQNGQKVSPNTNNYLRGDLIRPVSSTTETYGFTLGNSGWVIAEVAYPIDPLA